MEGDDVRKVSFVFFCSIVALAALGLIIQLATEPLQLLFSILKTFIVVAVLFAIVYFLFFRSKQSNNQTQKYKQAVKQSQKKYGNIPKQKTQKSSASAPKKYAKRRVSHLRVIEGNKPKKDDHASF